MTKLTSIGIGLVIALWSLYANASLVSYTGTLAQDDEVLAFDFSLTTTSRFMARTWSFGGGVNGSGSLISAGGFVPILSLFDGNGSQLLQAISQPSSGSCGPGTSNDPATGYCWDAYLSMVLAPGDYKMFLTQDDNTPLGPTLSDGFLHSGEGNFTGPNYLGDVGQCVMVGGVQRSCDWALDISNSSNDVPEPPALALIAGLGLVFSGRRHFKNATN